MVSVFQAILLNSLNMSFVALLLMAVLFALKNLQSPKIRYYSWLIVLVGFLIPVRFNFGKALIRVSDGASSAPAVSGPGTHLVEAASSGMSLDMVFRVLFVVYLLGVVTFLTISIFRFLRWKRTVLRLSRSYADYDAFLEPVAEEMGISDARLLLTKAVSSPMMIGLLSPTILLPKRKYDYDELRLILKHELTHYQHKDLWIKLLLIVCRAFHWFNPFMILFGRSIEKECEYYCDMSVMEVEPASMRKVYCQSILNTLADQVQRKNSSFRPVLATSFYSPKTGLKHRFSMVLSGKKRMIAGILVLTVLLTAVSGFAISTASSDTDSSEAESEPETTAFVDDGDSSVTAASADETTFIDSSDETTFIDSGDESMFTDTGDETTFVDPGDETVFVVPSENATDASESESWTDATVVFESDSAYEVFQSEPYAPTSSVADS